MSASSLTTSSTPPAAGSIEENIYTRQLYKQQMSSIGYEGKFEKRMFDGIIDERGQKGERAFFTLASVASLHPC
jgi:hypothetical protein